MAYNTLGQSVLQIEAAGPCLSFYSVTSHEAMI